ncbi:tetratricopeptide repeat protein [Streptomyces sp. NPDC004561]
MGRRNVGGEGEGVSLCERSASNRPLAGGPDDDFDDRCGPADVAGLFGPAAGTVFAVAAETVTSGPCPVRLERLGRPEVKNVLMSENGVDTANTIVDLRDLCNAEDPFRPGPHYMDAYRSRLNANLAFFDGLDDKLDWPTDPDGTHPLTELLLADFLVVDVAKPYAEDSYCEIERALLAGRSHTTCGGRSPNDDVIDTLYTLIVNASHGPRVGDGVDRATAPASREFPYLAPRPTSTRRRPFPSRRPREPMSGGSVAGRAGDGTRLGLADGPTTTAGVIAMANLDARIEGLAWQAARESLTGDGWGELVELTALRGHVLGRIDEAERAASLADAFIDRMPGDPRSRVARARLAALFHRFPAALVDLDAAAALGLDRRSLDEERAAVHQAVGRYDEALALHRHALSGGHDSRAPGALARCHAERGDAAEAERWFLAARCAYHGVSPFPLALLEFHCGQAWLSTGDPERARPWLESAIRRLPPYAPALARLAGVHAAEGRTSEAVGHLRRLALDSDDPYYAAPLARTLRESREPAEANVSRLDDHSSGSLVVVGDRLPCLGDQFAKPIDNQ